MIIERTGSGLKVMREATDRSLYGDSRFMYHVKQAIQRTLGLDCIKKLAWKDGHLVDNHMHYIRARDWSFYVWDTQAAIRSISEDYRSAGYVHLAWLSNKT